MLPVITCAPDERHLERLLQLLDEAAEQTGVHAQVVLSTTDAEEAQDALKKIQGIILVLTWLPPLDGRTIPACVQLGRQAMSLNHDSYTLYIVNKATDLIHAARICSRSYALLMSEDLKATGLTVLTQLLEDFQALTGNDSAVGEDFIMLHVNKTYMRITKQDIRYIESLEKKLIFYLGNQSLSLYSSFATCEEMLKDQFFRCHRSYLVNIAHIQAINLPTLTLTLSDGTVLPISRAQRANAKELLKNMQEVISNA